MTTASQPAPVSRISEAEIAHYRSEGYVIPQTPVFQDPAEFAALKTHFDGMVTRLPAGVRPEGMDVPHFHEPALFRWLSHPDVLDIVERFIGPDIALFSSHFVCKPAGDGKRVPWHEDSAYWKGQIVPMEIITLWLAIDPSHAGNGAMKVIPRTHGVKDGYSEYDDVPDPELSVFATEIRTEALKGKREVLLELQPNQCSLHHGKLMHGSAANTSSQRRCGYTMRYMSTRCRLDPSWYEFHNLYLMRGQDHAGNQYADPTKDYLPLLAERARIFGARKGH